MGVVTGTFQYPNGSPVANGLAQFKLSSDAIEFSGTSACIVPPIIKSNLDANGNVTATFAFNDVLSTTAGAVTTYQLTVKDNGGGQVWNENYYFTGTAANLNLIPPGASGPPVVTVTTTPLIVGGTPLLNLQNGVPDQTGNSFYGVASLGAWFCGHWEFAHTATAAAFVSFSMHLPSTITASATVLLEVFSADTATHTAVLQTSDALVTPGASMSISALTSAPAQTYTSSSTIYSRTTLSFPVQSTLTANGMLIVNATASLISSTANMMMLPYLRFGA